MKKFLMMFALAIVMVSMAGATTIGDLVGTNVNTGLVVGDKVFYDFTCGVSAAGGASYSCTDVNAWTVNPLAADPFGIQFVSNLLTAVGSIDIALGFKVTSLQGSTISGILLSMTPSISGGGIAKIAETAQDISDLNNVGVALVQKWGATNDISDPLAEQNDVLTLVHTATTLQITKDILVQACFVNCSTDPNNPNLAGITNFSQRFEQTGETPEIPEPGTYAMMGAGLLALAAIRRRKA